MKLLAHYISALTSAQPDIVNWRENYLNDSLFYSFRSTSYTRETYPSSLHYHDYYELVIVEEGDIHYICEGITVLPQHGDIVLIPPRKLHMSVINAEATHYKRHVFYLYTDALDALGCKELTTFLTADVQHHVLLSLKPQDQQALLSLLNRLDQALKTGEEKDRALSYGLIIEIFYYLSLAQSKEASGKTPLPQSVLNIKQYIDENFAQITSVSQIAAHFFYSREYVSRLFKQHFNTPIADYITKRRIASSQELIADGTALIDVCYQVGFGSMTAFIRAFRSITGMTPSQYRTILKERL